MEAAALGELAVKKPDLVNQDLGQIIDFWANHGGRIRVKTDHQATPLVFAPCFAGFVFAAPDLCAIAFVADGSDLTPLLDMGDGSATSRPGATRSRRCLRGVRRLRLFSGSRSGRRGKVASPKRSSTRPSCCSTLVWASSRLWAKLPLRGFWACCAASNTRMPRSKTGEVPSSNSAISALWLLPVNSERRRSWAAMTG